MTTPGKHLAVVRLYQPEIAGGLGSSCDPKPQVRPCGDEENRTLNPRLAKAVLCQLSYVPWRTGSAARRGADTITLPSGPEPKP